MTEEEEQEGGEGGGVERNVTGKLDFWTKLRLARALLRRRK
jgi:hypothetical protein